MRGHVGTHQGVWLQWGLGFLPTEEERKVAECLASLSETELTELESQAFEKADAWLREGYERCDQEGCTTTREQYRRMIVEALVRHNFV